ncbi:4Fe-4S binding protein [Comamonadaceae bacterium G21597-S1]|nr:4Fe-4S binding protein [Comamonadaceae bacterium G21597-S1]
MPLDPRALGASLNENLTLHSSLCRREAGRFLAAATQSGACGDDLVVACTQEKRLFLELAQQVEPPVAPIRFVNIRETGGWSKDASKAGPKIAALLALAHLPDPEPVTTAAYKSAGRMLIIGPLGAAEQAASLMGEDIDVTVFSLGVGEADVSQERRYPVLAGAIERLSGYLGAFELQWSRSNPINLDLCTRCNACVAACPEGAIGLDYQIDMAACRSHRACVTACSAAGAIDFNRDAQSLTETFDLVLDLRATAAFSQHAKPQGYLHWNGRDLQPLLQLRALVGEFEKPRFVAYKQKLCAHSRNERIGCNACVDICSASAIRSERGRQRIVVDANLCVGCGACSTVCPTGALSYSYPRAGDQGVRLKTALATYLRNGGKQPAVLLHNQQGASRMLDDLGRAAQLDPDLHGVPARVLPLSVWHDASVGLELWLAAIAYGAAQVWLMTTEEDAPQYRDALQEQLAVAQAVMTGLGYAGEHFRVLHVRDARDLEVFDRDLRAAPAGTVARAGGFAVQADKRATLELALAHLIEQAPGPRSEAIGLPAKGSPLGALAIDKNRCTLCLSCVNACPAAALQDNPDAPQLRFIEQNCVQCGLCVGTCPEKALSLVPQLNLAPQRKQAVVLNEMQPYACIRCNKPFGTLKAVEAMIGKLAGHAMFQGEALERLKMCSDCRVIDLYSASNEVKITDL